MNYLALLIVLGSFPVAMAISKNVKVKVEKATLEIVENSLYYPVIVKSRVNSQIKADSDLIVMEKSVQLGQKVKKGDPLLELRHSDLNTNYRNRILKAPISGVVAGIHVQKGNYVGKGKLLITLNDPENIYGNIEIPIADFKKIKKGLKAEITFELGLKSTSEIIGVGAMADSELGTVPVEVSLQGNKALLPGTIGQAKVSLTTEELILVDENALYYSGEDIFIPLVKDMLVQKVPIELGRRFKNKVEIISGLEVGEVFVIDAPKFLRDKQKVEVDVKRDS